MTFNEAIEAIVNPIKDGGASVPFILSRQNGEWDISHVNENTGLFDALGSMRDRDPFAIIYAGNDFSDGNYSSVYNTVLYDRLRAEYYADRSAGIDAGKFNALTCFFHDNVGAFSEKTTDYLTTLERPLAALAEMCPLDLTTNIPEWDYNRSLANSAISSIEDAVGDCLQNRDGISTPKSREGLGMTFNEAIDKIMPEVNAGSKEPFIIYRDGKGEWHSDFTQNQYGDTFDWVEDAKAQDAFAGTFTGADFARGSYPRVYDQVLIARLWEEYRSAPSEELNALADCIEDNIGELSGDVTDYIVRYDKPLSMLEKMLPMSLVKENSEHGYDEDKAMAALDLIEGKIKDFIARPIDEPFGINAEKPALENQGHDGYKELHKISINSSDVILSENPNAEYRYMVVENRYTSFYNESGDNNIFTGHTNDFLEAITAFTEKVKYNIDCVQSRRDTRQNLHGVDYVELKSGDCVPGSNNADYTGQLIIVKADALKPEYRSAENQLMRCTHGNGARPDALGTSVFGKELYTGESVNFRRHQIEGIADVDKLPKWAVDKLQAIESEREPDIGAASVDVSGEKPRESTPKAPDKKPSLLGKLDDNKQKVERDKAERKDQPPSQKRSRPEQGD